MDKRGKMILGLSRKVPRGETPLRDVSNSSLRASLGFKSAMDKCQRFLDKLKTPAEIRQMEEIELRDMEEEPFYGEENLEPVDKNVEAELEKTTGHVDFGNIGFMSFGGETIPDNNQNLDNENPVDGNSVASGEKDEERPTELAEKSASPETENVSTTEVVEPLERTSTVENPTENDPTEVNTEVTGGAEVSQSVESVQPLEKCTENSPETNSMEVNVVNNDGETAEQDTDATRPKPKEPKKRKRTQKTVKEKRMEKKPVDEDRSPATIKKCFKDNTLTVKVKLSDIQRKAGTIPDFAFFLKDDVHDPKARPACPHAGKYIAYMKGNLSKKFFSKSGISFLSSPNEFFLCANDADFTEDRLLPFQMANEAGQTKDTVAERPIVVEKNVPVESSSDSFDSSDTSRSDDEYLSDSDPEDLPPAKKVVWGAPQRESSQSSSSSGGVNVYGRAAQKTLSKEKKQKKKQKKKDAKDASAKARVDILDEPGPSKPSKKATRGGASKGGASKGAGSKGAGSKGGGRGGRGGRGGKGGSSSKVSRGASRQK
jgi:hypothetical protein